MQLENVLRIIHDRKDDCTAFRHILYGKFSNDLNIDFRRIAIIEIYTNFSKANLVFVVLRIKVGFSFCVPISLGQESRIRGPPLINLFDNFD